MAKKPAKKKSSASSLSRLAEFLLHAMAVHPDRVEYNTRVLGGAFEDPDLKLLDDAYIELAGLGLVEEANAVISFFGAPKVLYRITEAGLARVRSQAA